MQEATGSDPFVVFTPSMGRFWLTEFLSAILAVAAAAAANYVFRGTMDRSLFSIIVGLLIALAIKATFGLRSRRIVISDRWITGPSRLGLAVRLELGDRVVLVV